VAAAIDEVNLVIGLLQPTTKARGTRSKHEEVQEQNDEIVAIVMRRQNLSHAPFPWNLQLVMLSIFFVSLRVLRVFVVRLTSWRDLRFAQCSAQLASSENCHLVMMQASSPSRVGSAGQNVQGLS
jgi:hypothetical protein